MKILSGAYAADSGKITLFGEQISNATTATMIERGVAVIYQEACPGAPSHPVAENILMGRLPKNHGLIDWAEANRRAAEVITRLGRS